MTLTLNDISHTGLDQASICRYSITDKVKQMVIDLGKPQTIMPAIKVYSQRNNDGKWVIADGIHRVVAYILTNTLTFKAEIS